ncbi:rod-binding protein [Roseovarius sp.]|uniref:rod-binding protein n=1 Tax=Roseovarius sp. TaxID=1486281 RepID=UPI003A96EC72
MTDSLSVTSEIGGRSIPPKNPVRLVAERLEASFLAEMLKFGGLESKENDFGDSAGESQFASFHREALAREMVRAGGIGLADVFFYSMMERSNGS